MGVDEIEVKGDKEHHQIMSEETPQRVGSTDMFIFDKNIPTRRSTKKPEEKREYLCFKRKEWETIKPMIANNRPNITHKGKWILEVTKTGVYFGLD